MLASQKYVCVYIAKLLLSFNKEVQSLEVNITIKFFAFEWVGVDLLTLTADTEDFPEFLISKETLKIALGCTETEEVEECLQGNSLFVETWTKYFANLNVLKWFADCTSNKYIDAQCRKKNWTDFAIFQKKFYH